MEEKKFEAEDLVDDIEDFNLEETKLVYEVWVIGFDSNGIATDFEYLVDDGYAELTEAKKCFDYFADTKNIAELLNARGIEVTAPTTHLHLVLEECTDSIILTECQNIVEEVEIF